MLLNGMHEGVMLLAKKNTGQDSIGMAGNHKLVFCNKSAKNVFSKGGVPVKNLDNLHLEPIFTPLNKGSNLDSNG